jgi:hypothetical protein
MMNCAGVLKLEHQCCSAFLTSARGCNRSNLENIALAESRLLLRWLNFRRYFDYGVIVNKRCQEVPENLNFPPITVNNLFKFPAQGSDLTPFYWLKYLLKLTHLYLPDERVGE